MTTRLEELVAWLEQFTLEEHLANPEQLAEVVEERRVVLSELERADRSTLTPERRTELKARLASVLARDAAVIEALHKLREDVQKALDQVSSGRAAARGYASQSEKPTPSVRRLG